MIDASEGIKNVYLSAVVPFHRDLMKLRTCLRGIRAAATHLPAGALLCETIVVADGAPEDPSGVAATHGAMVVAIDGPRGPATARNRGAAVASGDVLVFVDSDVAIDANSLAHAARRFASDPDLTALFGAYDEDPTAPGFISQGKNLAHCFIHRRSAGEARTFWAGIGAVRADAFASLGGFDERFTRPSVEDIDLGYRIRASNGRIVLDPAIRGRHMKRWTLRSAVMTEIRDRGIPWTQLLHRYEGFHEDLNLTRLVPRLCRRCLLGCCLCRLRHLVARASRTSRARCCHALAARSPWTIDSSATAGDSAMRSHGSRSTCCIISATGCRSLSGHCCISRGVGRVFRWPARFRRLPGASTRE